MSLPRLVFLVTALVSAGCSFGLPCPEQTAGLFSRPHATFPEETQTSVLILTNRLAASEVGLFWLDEDGREVEQAARLRPGQVLRQHARAAHAFRVRKIAGATAATLLLEIKPSIPVVGSSTSSPELLVLRPVERHAIRDCGDATLPAAQAAATTTSPFAATPGVVRRRWSPVFGGDGLNGGGGGGLSTEHSLFDGLTGPSGLAGARRQRPRQAHHICPTQLAEYMGAFNDWQSYSASHRAELGNGQLPARVSFAEQLVGHALYAGLLEQHDGELAMALTVVVHDGMTEADIVEEMTSALWRTHLLAENDGQKLVKLVVAHLPPRSYPSEHGAHHDTIMHSRLINDADRADDDPARLAAIKRPSSILKVVELMSAVVRGRQAASWGPGGGWAEEDYREALAVAVEHDLVAPTVGPPSEEPDPAKRASSSSSPSSPSPSSPATSSSVTDVSSMDFDFVPLFEVHGGSGFITAWTEQAADQLLRLGGAAVRQIGPRGASLARNMSRLLAEHTVATGLRRHDLAGAEGGGDDLRRDDDDNRTLLIKRQARRVDTSRARNCYLPSYLRDKGANGDGSGSGSERQGRRRGSVADDLPSALSVGAQRSWRQWPTLMVMARATANRLGVGTGPGLSAPPFTAPTTTTRTEKFEPDGGNQHDFLLERNRAGGALLLPELVCAAIECIRSPTHVIEGLATGVPPFEGIIGADGWRERRGVERRSPLGDGKYSKLRRLSAAAWAAGVTEPAKHAKQRPRDIETRFVLDGLMTDDECLRLRMALQGGIEGGASYTGDMLKIALKSRMGAASWERSTNITLVRDVISRGRSALMAYFNISGGLTPNNVMAQARVAPGTGLDTHSDDCAYREDRGEPFCEPSTSRHMCCTSYHYAAVMMLSDQGGVRRVSEETPARWRGSQFYWQDRFSSFADGDGGGDGAKEEDAALTGGSDAEAVHRIRVENKCGRLVGFDSGESNPHGVMPISPGSGGGASDALGVAEAERAAERAGAVAHGGALPDLDKDGSNGARWSLTMWFSTVSHHSMPQWQPLPGEQCRARQNALLDAKPDPSPADNVVGGMCGGFPELHPVIQDLGGGKEACTETATGS